MTDREIIKIAVTPQAKLRIEQTSERYGMSQIAMASRVYEWFAQQDEVIQATVLNLLPDAVAPEVAQLILNQLAGKAHERPARKAAKKAGKTTRTTRRRSS